MLPELGKRVGQYWPVIIIDEGHIIRNRKTKGFQELTKLASSTLWWVSGTPIVNKPDDLWVPLHLVAPNDPEARSYWRFVNKYCFVEQNYFGGTEVFGVKDPQGFRDYIGQYLYRKARDEVQDQFPTKQRLPTYTELSVVQTRGYDALVEDMMVGWDSSQDPLLVPNNMALLTRLRQLLITPALIGGPNVSGTLDTLAELVGQDLGDGQSVLILTPFAQAIRYIKHALETASKDTHIYEFHGDQSRRMFNDNIDVFQTDSDPAVLIGTIRSAASFSASKADVVYMVGYDFTPAYNEQAEDRALGNDPGTHVDVRYLVAHNTIDEHVIDIVNQKQTWSNIAMDPHRLFKPHGGQRHK